jgi:hypothetical protein
MPTPLMREDLPGAAEVARRFAEIADTAAAIDRRLRAEVGRLGFESETVQLLPARDALYRLERDPADGGWSLVGEWRDECGLKLGVLLFHADGSFFVEQDVVRTHPLQPRWFVEAITAWGSGASGSIKAEPRLLARPD